MAIKLIAIKLMTIKLGADNEILRQRGRVRDTQKEPRDV